MIFNNKFKHIVIAQETYSFQLSLAQPLLLLLLFVHESVPFFLKPVPTLRRNALDVASFAEDVAIVIADVSLNESAVRALDAQNCSKKAESDLLLGGALGFECLATFLKFLKHQMGKVRDLPHGHRPPIPKLLHQLLEIAPGL